MDGGIGMEKTTIDAPTAARGTEASQEPTSDVVRQRLTGQFAPAYLTLVSIIQGVALSTLAARVEATYSGFRVADWLLTAATFLTILSLWHEYVMQVLAYIWLPTFFDSLVPFAFVATELFLAHLVSHNMRAWLLAYGGFYLVGVAAWYLQNRQIRTADAESRRIDRVLSPHDRFRLMFLVVCTALSLAMAGFYTILRIGQMQLAVAIGIFVVACLFLGRSVPA